MRAEWQAELGRSMRSSSPQHAPSWQELSGDAIASRKSIAAIPPSEGEVDAPGERIERFAAVVKKDEGDVPPVARADKARTAYRVALRATGEWALADQAQVEHVLDQIVHQPGRVPSRRRIREVMR